MLFHLFRGTGLVGMASIRPKRDRIIRPLLAVGREEIESWLKEEGISWCSDRTNDTDEYTRNRIRRHILSYAVKEISAEADLHLAAEADLLAQTADLVNELTEEAMERCCRFIQEETIVIDAEGFAGEKELIRTQLIYLLLKRLSGGGRDVTMAHVEQVHSLFMGQSGRRVSLPGQLEAVKNFEEVILRKRREDGDEPMLTELFSFSSGAPESISFTRLRSSSVICPVFLTSIYIYSFSA